MVRTKLHSFPPDVKRRPGEGAAVAYLFSSERRGGKGEIAVRSLSPFFRGRGLQRLGELASLSRSWVRGNWVAVPRA